MKPRRTAAAAALTTALVLTGCAGQGAGPGAAPSASAPSAPGAASAAPSASGAPPTSQPAAPPSGGVLDPAVPTLLPKDPVPRKPANGPRTISGDVIAGVEPNCLILRDATGDYLLLTGPTAATPPRAGDRITATGTVDTSRVTTCQQGTPFVVSEVRPG